MQPNMLLRREYKGNLWKKFQKKPQAGSGTVRKVGSDPNPDP